MTISVQDFPNADCKHNNLTKETSLLKTYLLLLFITTKLHIKYQINILLCHIILFQGLLVVLVVYLFSCILVKDFFYFEEKIQEAAAQTWTNASQQ